MRPLLLLPLLLVLLAVALSPAVGFVVTPPSVSVAAAAAASLRSPHQQQQQQQQQPALVRLPPLLASAAPSSSSSTEGPSYFEWLGRQVELKLRPKPYVDGIRLQVDKDLAVLLMRSSYSISDDLDFIAMDQFQKEFFFVRQAEWEGGWGGLGSRSLRVILFG